MGAEAEPEPSSTPRLLLFSKPNTYIHMESPERSGTLTPPIYSTASVPFRWEEEPGKPRQCFTPLSNHMDLAHRCLELPPRLLMDANVTKLPSPTTVLDGPYYGGKSRFQSSSFRIIRRECYGPFHRSCSLGRAHQLGTMVRSKRGFWGSWRKVLKGKREVGDGGNYVFLSSMERDVDCSNEDEEEEVSSGKKAKITSIKRAGSFSTLSNAKSQFWTTIYEGFKQVVPWRRKRRTGF